MGSGFHRLPGFDDPNAPVIMLEMGEQDRTGLRS